MLEVSRRRISLPDEELEIALLDWGGTGPLALLHHANGFCAGVWDLVAMGLRERFHVVAMDARGHGDSSKPRAAAAYRWANFGRDLVAVADALAAEHPAGRIALGLGHSIGGTAMIMASAARPELFERLVLLDPIIMPAGGIAEGMRKAHGRQLAERARGRRHVWTSREEARAKWRGKDMFAGWDPRAFDLYLAEGFFARADGQVELKCPGEVEAAIFEFGSAFDAMALAPDVALPVLILWAMRGNFPRRLYEDLAARLRDSRVRDANTGHFLPMEDPALVIDEVLAFSAR
jgi:pimeloyl-ACP methyl ester carboxylesterase